MAVSTIRVSGWDQYVPPAYAGGTDLAGRWDNNPLRVEIAIRHVIVSLAKP